MDFPKMLYKGVKPNAFDRLEAEQSTTVQDAEEEAQARKAGWHGFDEQPQAAEQAPKAAKSAAKADKAAEQAPKLEG